MDALRIERGQPLPERADAADFLASGWTPEEVDAWLRERLVTLEQFESVAVEPAAGAHHANGNGHQSAPPADQAGAEPVAAPFQPLGYDHGRYYYMARGAKQVLELSAAAHTKANLIGLAPLTYWEREHPSKGGANWDLAANALIRQCEQAGVYDPARVRGRGAWWDDGVPVLHLGDRLVVKGEPVALHEYRGRYVYEAAPPMRVNLGNPLSAGEAYRLVELCRLLPWEKPVNATLLAGWCVVAIICGALRWRPHIWLTGPAGSGKSYLVEHVLRRCLGDMALAVQSETTAAGIRQALGSDARPVIFDEAEAESARAQARIQAVMALMRQASSETGAVIAHGTTDGEGITYRPRSCFAFASIGVGVKQYADQTRVTVLSLTLDHRTSPTARAERFQRFERTRLDLLSPAYVECLHARAIRLIPVIRENAETFATAGAQVIGTRRLGDQIGALLAGAYALRSDGAVSFADASAWVEAQSWEDEAQLQDEQDEQSCLQRIVQHVVPVQARAGRFDRTLGELIETARIGGDADVSAGVAQETLARYGLAVDGDTLLVANHHPALARALADTAWSIDWARTLKRLPGATPGPRLRFAGSAQTRTVAVPLSLLEDDSTGPEVEA